jgi:hypothetical protein
MESMTSSDMYAVTNTGYKALEDGFSSASPKKARKKTSGKSPKKADTPDWLRGMSVDDQLEDFPSYRQLSTRKDRVLWILQWASQAGRERLTGTEITAIADKLSDNIPTQQIAASFAPHLSNNRVSKNSEGYKILYDGIEYLKTVTNQKD